jgi:hypothetical protein
VTGVILFTHAVIWSSSLNADLVSVLVRRLGYYLPFAAFAGAATAIACGLISTWDPNTSTANWIGHQILFGLRGVGLQMVSCYPPPRPSSIPVAFLLNAPTVTNG